MNQRVFDDLLLPEPAWSNGSSTFELTPAHVPTCSMVSLVPALLRPSPDDVYVLAVHLHASAPRTRSRRVSSPGSGVVEKRSAGFG